MKRRTSILLVPLLALTALAIAVGTGPLSTSASGQDKGAGEKPKEGPDPRAADKEAIQKAAASFAKALESGDAKAVAAHWTEQGEYTGAEGDTLKGQADIAKAYAEFLKEYPKLKVLDRQVESLRFLSKDSAIKEAKIKAQKTPDGDTITSHYTILYVREDGKWLMAMVREGRGQTAHLSGLDWLVGRWSASRDGVEMQADYEWIFGKAFLQSRFTVKTKGETTSGIQMIGRDPATGQIRSWTFDSEGGFGHAVWQKDGKLWTNEASGIQSDGAILTATNIMTRVDVDTFTWQSTQRTIDGAPMPDLPPVRVTRVKAGK